MRTLFLDDQNWVFKSNILSKPETSLPLSPCSANEVIIALGNEGCGQPTLIAGFEIFLFYYSELKSPFREYSFPKFNI